MSSDNPSSMPASAHGNGPLVEVALIGSRGEFGIGLPVLEQDAIAIPDDMSDEPSRVDD